MKNKRKKKNKNKRKDLIITIILVILYCGVSMCLFFVQKNRTNDLKNTFRYTFYTKDVIVIDRKIPRSIYVFKEVDDLEKRFGDKTIYLKHKIENSIVTESYVCIEKNDKTYCLSGGQIKDSFVNYNKKGGEKKFKKDKELASLAYDSNKKSLEDIFDSDKCEEETGHIKTIECKDETLDILINDWGDVEVTYNQEEQCIVRSAGISGCFKK